MSDVFDSMLYWKYHLEYGREVMLIDRGRKLLVRGFIVDKTMKNCEPHFWGYRIDEERPDGTLALSNMFKIYRDADGWSFNVEEEAITVGIYNDVARVVARFNS